MINIIRRFPDCWVKSTAQRGYLSSNEFVRRFGLRNCDLKAVADRLKATKYFNVVIQAQVAAMNLAKDRGLAWRI
jgi:hypothetical protein